MLTARDFQHMPMNMQIDILMKNGTPITSREHEKRKIDLYSLYDFFVEVWYFTCDVVEQEPSEPDKLDIITDIVTITKNDGLNIYIDLFKQSKIY